MGNKINDIIQRINFINLLHTGRDKENSKNKAESRKMGL